MKKIKLGLLLGIIAGVIDIILMIAQQLTWDANLSALVFWIVTGFLIASSQLKLKGMIRGVSISLLVLLPVAIIIGWQEPLVLIPVVATNLIFGATLGWMIDKYGK